MKRQPANLSESLCHRLNSYALAAGAAGVGALALADPAEAKIIYTPAHKVAQRCTHDANRCLKIDLNHDGKADFSLVLGQSTYYKTSNIWLFAAPAGTQRNYVAGYLSGASDTATGVAYPLFAREEIDSGLSFSGRFMAGRSRVQGKRSGRCGGVWNNVRNRYLGLKLGIKGQIHYGWARLNETCLKTGNVGVKAVLTGYAYETIPNRYIVTGKTEGQEIITPEPGLGSLARGFAAGPQR